ncbi:zinc finger protein [Trichonephila clavipes]|uniref:Zinc finger protein n=1 Tax=Trichonephila clavipes TaxID=2585209 RepID=A0A8X6SDH3_TRICX|nr:zinc finger protein [Trichonephila clavipes]
MFTQLTTAKPDDPDLQNIHLEVGKSEPRGEKAGSGFSSSPRSKARKAKRSVDSDGFTPPNQLVRNARSSPRSSPPPSQTPPSAPSVDGALLEGTGEGAMELTQQVSLQAEIVVPVVVKKPHIPPFFVSPKGDWRQLVALAKLVAPSFQSQMSGRFLKVTVGDEVEYRDLSRWLENSGVEFKSFMLKQDRPVKVVVCGLPSNTEPEDIKAEIEAEGFKVIKISQMKNYRTKAPMPLFYVQIENGVDAPKIYDFTELFGTRIEVKPFDRGNKINQCGRCQGWFHSSEVCHAARCPKHPNNSKKKNKNGPKPNNPRKKTVTQAPRPDISKARKVSPNLDYSKVVQNLIPREHVRPPPSTSQPTITPVPRKDAGLLKDLLVLIEECPSISKQDFCRAFKNSLSLSLCAPHGICGRR